MPDKISVAICQAKLLDDPLPVSCSPLLVSPKMKRPRQLWPDGSGCKSCGTRRRDHKFRGYCTRCHPIIYRISRIDRGLYHPRGQEPYPDSFLATIRKNALAELEEIREFEAPVRDGATGIDIENLLVAIAQNTRAKPEKLDGVRHFFDGCLNVEQRTRTYGVLAALAENLPGRRSVQQSFMLKHRQALENAEWKAKLSALGG
jgi:hypothetical protein